MSEIEQVREENRRLLTRIEDLERRERESDLELRAALLQYVAYIERKHKVGAYSEKRERPLVDLSV